MAEVVVTAMRFSPRIPDSPSSVTVIGARRLLAGTAASLADGLSMVPGIFVKDYGGNSGLKTISQRGLGAEHSLILVNGVRVSSFQNGLVDLGMYPLGDVRKIEIVHGGYSSAYGSDAIGGVVNVLTHAESIPSSLNVETALGSFGYQRVGVSGGIGWNEGGVRIGVGSERSREDYPFVFRNGPLMSILNRRNTDFHAMFATLDSRYPLSPQSGISLYSRGYTSERGVGGPVVSTGGGKESARQNDDDLLAQILFQSENADKDRISLNAQTHYTYQRYRDPGLKIGQSDGLDTYFRNVDYRAIASVELFPKENLGVNFGVEGAATRADGKSLRSEVVRWQGASFFAGRYSVIRNSSVLSDFAIYPSIRFDAATGSIPASSPSVGAVFTFQGIAITSVSRVIPHLRGTFNRNFRMPTFNELYYSGGGGVGNPELRPEQSVGYDLGGGLTASTFGTHFLQFTYFENNMTDRIVWVPAGSQGVTPRNIREVRSKGIEISWSWQDPAQRLSVEVNYSTFDTRKTTKEGENDRNVNKQLIYVPRESANASLTWSLPLEMFGITAIEGTLLYRFIGVRYVNEDNSSSLPPYDILDASVLFHWGLKPVNVTTKLEVKNLFDSEYQDVSGYPMPLRALRMSLQVGY